MLFLLCALMVGSSSVRADEVTIASFSNSNTTGWTINGSPSYSATGGYQLVSSDKSIVSPSIDWSGYTSITITIKARKYGGPNETQGKISVKQGDTELTTVSPTSTSLSDYGPTSISPTGTGSITISCPGASSSKGCGVSEITIKGTEAIDPSAPAATLSTTSLDFGKVNFGSTKDLTFTVTPANLTSDLTIACDNAKYEVSPTSIASSVTTETTITVTAKPTALEDDMDGTITISGGGLASNKVVSLTTEVTDPDANDGSLEKPFTVVEAIANCPASGTSDNVYIKGIVSKFYGDDIVSDGSNYRYYISDDGTTTNQLLVYKGKKNSTDNFSDASDLLLGDEVIIYGGLTTYSSTKEVASGNYIYSLTRKADPELIVEDDFSMEVTTTKNAEDLYVATSDGEVTFTSDAEKVANVVGGKLEAYAPGTATITVTIASTATYAAGSGSFVVTVTTKPAVDPEGLGAGEGYRLVTDASTLAEGDKLLFVGEKADKSTYVMGEQNSTNRAAVAVTIEDNVISSKPGTAQEVLLEGTTGNWYFNVGEDAYLYAAAPTANNHLKTDTKDNVGDAGKATISMKADGASTITFQCEGTRNVLQFNPSGLFSCYASTQNDVYLYRYFSSTTFDITIDSKGDGWRTIVTAASATLPSGLKAYIASADESDKVTLTEVASLKANNAYILYGAVGDYTLTVTDSPVEPTGNELRVSTNTDGNGAFVLAKKGGVVGFYKWNGGSLGAGRVILPASAVPDAEGREFIGLGDATAISNVAVETKSDNRYYNLAGQVVAQPTKGLYIVNGKKVIIK